MADIPNTLFSETQRKILSANQKISSKQKEAAKKWKDDLDIGKLDIESQNKSRLRDLMIVALGYPPDKIDEETGEQNTRLDYSYIPASGTKGVLFELKSRNKKLFEFQNYKKIEQETPVRQALTYIAENPKINYAVVTNFQQFVLITRANMSSQCYKFTFPPKGSKLFDSEIKEFIYFFSKKGIESGHTENAIQATIREEDTITDDFYKLYHQTRLMLIHAFNEKKRVEYDDAIKIAQTYLNRLIFLFFAEDNGLIKKRVFTDGILSVLDSGNIKEKTISVSGYIQTLFSWMDEGSDEIDNKSGFNGEFFKEPIDRNAFFYDFQTQKFFDNITKKVQVPARIKLNKENQNSIDRYESKISPIITNFLKMASFNFKHKDPDDVNDDDIDDSNDQISVSILGHIFEQSIGDLEELQTNEPSQRKKEGVFYTPDYITEYICKNTIIPYLSQNEATEPHHLVMEYKDNLKELEDKIDGIKILDPACGSGAFLVKAVDVLISIIDEIQNFKHGEGESTISKKGKMESRVAKQTTFDKEHETDKARRKLIQNNIYGVDINSESVEITKLSLFLKIASKNKRLIGLSERIQIGNSIIDDETVDKKAFDWNNRFIEILHPEIGEKFDIIIGNPPYLRIQGLHESHDHTTSFIEKNYVSATGRYDFYVLFIEKCISLLKKKGYLGYITPHKFTNAKFGKGIRKILSQNKIIHKFLSFGHNFVFKDATTYSAILILKNEENKNILFHEIDDIGSSKLKTEMGLLKEKDFVKIDQNKLDETPWSLHTGVKASILDKIHDSGPNILNYFDKILQGIITGYDDLYFLKLIKDKGNTKILFSTKTNTEVEIEDELLKPILFGEDVKRNKCYTETKYFLLHPYVLENMKQRILEESELKSNYPLTYKYLFLFKSDLEKLKIKYKMNPKYWQALHRSRKQEWFEQEKIITPEISFGCNMTLDSNKNFHNSKVYSFLKKSDVKINIKYFLGILNSKTLWFFLKCTGDVLRGGYFTFKTQYLEPFHIPNPPNSQFEQEISSKVNTILNLNKKFDELIFEFINALSTSFDLDKISKNLDKFYYLDWSEFISEIPELKKIDPPSISKWQKYFEETKQEILEQKKSFTKIESEIDHMVYDLYGFSQEEIIEIAKNYPVK